MSGLLDALSYAGDIGDKFGGRAVRGLLAGKPRELLSPIPFSDSLGITDPKDITRGSDLVSKFGLARDDDPIGQAALGFGAEVATDPLTYLGGLGAARHAARALPEAAQASHWGALKNLREPSMLVKNIGTDAEHVVGRRLDRAAIPGVDEGLLSSAYAMNDLAPARGRMVSPWSESPFKNLGYARTPETARHELTHALTKNAAVSGGEENLGLASRLAARQYRAGGFKPTGFHMGAGDILDEIGAHAAEGRGTMEQLKGGLGFALSPERHKLYHDQFAGKSPLAASLFHSAPGAIPGAVGGAALGGEQGYEREGVGGGLAGAVLGGVGGAALGGAASHLAYAPNALTKGGSGVLGAESGALSRARRLSKDIGLAHENALGHLEDPATPLHRLKSLSEAIGTKLYMPSTAAEVMGLTGGKTQLGDFVGAYFRDDNEVLPNILDYGRQWGSSRDMAELVKSQNAKGHWSTPFADHVPVHELQHALHHQGIKGYLGRVENPNESVLELPFGKGITGDEWRSQRDSIGSLVSKYAAEKPLEFAAERGTQNTFNKFMGVDEEPEKFDALYRAIVGPGTDPRIVNKLHEIYGDDIGKALRGESGSLGLKYDNAAGRAVTPESVGLRRSDPEWVNNRTFYHGTDTPGLRAGDIDPRNTSVSSLYGRGIYTTDEAGSPDHGITAGYARARASGRSTPLIYQGQSDFGKILDLDEGPGKAFGGNVRELLMDAVRRQPEGGEWAEIINEKLANPGANAGDILKIMQKAVSGEHLLAGHQAEITRALRSEGYDALTHTGGLRTGNDYHQVVIGLDPNDKLGLGRATPYKQWELFKALTGQE